MYTQNYSLCGLFAKHFTPVQSRGFNLRCLQGSSRQWKWVSETGPVEAQLTAVSTLPEAFRPNFSQRLCWSNKMHTRQDDHIWPEGNLLITTDIKLKLRIWKACVIIKVWHTMHGHHLQSTRANIKLFSLACQEWRTGMEEFLFSMVCTEFIWENLKSVVHVDHATVRSL